MIKVGNQQMLKEINISTLLHTIFEHGAISRVELARKTKLSPTTVSILIEEMIQDKLVHEIGTTGKGVGRKKTLLNIRADGGYVIGIDLSNSPANCVLLNLSGEVIVNRSLKPLIGEQQLSEELPAFIQHFINEQQLPIDAIKRIGVSVPGKLDETQSEIILSRYLKVQHFPFKSILEEKLSIPVLISNDLHAAGFAEHFSGAARGDENTLFLRIDSGTGAGLFLNGRVYRGFNGTAGRTECFVPYCIAELASTLHKQYPDTFAALAPEDTIRTFVELALSGQQPYQGTMEQMINQIAGYCCILLQLINPQKMVLGGWITDHELLFKQLVTAIHKIENPSSSPTPILVFHWKKYGAAMGAATLGLYEIFKQITVR